MSDNEFFLRDQVISVCIYLVVVTTTSRRGSTQPSCPIALALMRANLGEIPRSAYFTCRIERKLCYFHSGLIHAGNEELRTHCTVRESEKGMETKSRTAPKGEPHPPACNLFRATDGQRCRHITLYISTTLSYQQARAAFFLEKSMDVHLGSPIVCPTTTHVYSLNFPWLLEFCDTSSS